MKKKNGKNLVKKEETPPTMIEKPGRGLEGPIDKEDLIIPRATLLQALSPQIADGIEGCKAGVVINSITNETLPEKFLPIFRFVEFLKFNPRDNKAENFDPAYEPGALIWRITDPKDPRTEECRFGEDGSKPLAMKVINFLCYFPGVTMPIVLGFSKTSFKAGKKLTSLAQFSGGDIFSKVYALKVKQADKDGIKYFIYDVALAGKANKEDFNIAENWYMQFRGKELRVDDIQPVTAVEETEEAE